MLRIGS
jgi:hypothetical protein